MKKIYVSYLEFKELFSIAQVLIDKAGNIITRFPLLIIIIARIQRRMKILEKSFNVNQSSAYTEALATLDKRRDSLFSGMFDYLKSLMRMGRKDKEAALSHLLRIFESFGYEMTNEPYAQQSVSMRKLFEMLREPASVEYLNQLQLQDDVQEMMAVENEFKTLVAERNTKENKDVLYEDAKVAFRQLFTDVQLLLDILDVLLEEQPNEELKQATNSINEYIADIMANAKARKTRKGNRIEGESTSEEEE